MVRIKICGITRPEDAIAAAVAGADAIGLNFIGGPRRIDVDSAAAILQALPAFCTPVALVDVSLGDVPADLLELIGRHWVSHLQLYGDVGAGTITRLRADGFHPIIVHAVEASTFADEIGQRLATMSTALPAAILLDAHVPGLAGGTGRTADWQAIAAAREAGAMQTWPPVMLAGGLNPENVAEAIRQVRPWAVDVSSGVESAPGRKDPEQMTAFVARAREAARN